MTHERPARWTGSTTERRARALVGGLWGALGAAGLFVACVSDVAPPSAAIADDASVTSDAAAGDGVDAADTGAATDAATSDAGDSGALDATDGGFDTEQLPGLRLWLESTRNLSTAPASKQLVSWTDSSKGVTNDTGLHVAMPTGTTPPEIVENAFGGRPTVLFHGGQSYLRIDNHPDFAFGTGEFFLVAVAKVTSGAGTFWSLQSSAPGLAQNFSGGQFCFGYGQGSGSTCTVPAIPPPPEPHVYVARREGDIFTVRVDGEVKGKLDRSGNPPNIVISPTDQPFVEVGSYTAMQLSELVVVVGQPPKDTLEALEAHLLSKYKLTP